MRQVVIPRALQYIGGPSGRAGQHSRIAPCVRRENVDGKRARFERHTLLEGLGAHNAIAADMDGDGDVDLVSKEFAPAGWNRLGGGQHADWLENRSGRVNG